MKPLTKLQIDTIIENAPRYSEFHFVYGKQVRKRWDNQELVWMQYDVFRLTRGQARIFAASHTVFSITHSVVKPLKVKNMPEEFRNCLD